MNKKEPLEINEDFLYLFEQRNPKKVHKKKKVIKAELQQIPVIQYVLEQESKPNPKINFKDNIRVFIEPAEIAHIRKLLDIVDKLKR